MVLKFAGTISGPPNQAIKYVFNRTINHVTTTSPPVSASLDRAGQLKVTDSFSVSGSQNGSDELQVLPSNVKASANFIVTCTKTASAKPNTHVNMQPFVVDGMYRAHYPYAWDRTKCEQAPATGWSLGIREWLKSAWLSEKAYYQEKDVYAGPQDIGFAADIPYGPCVWFNFTVGHYGTEPKARSVLITGQHINGGPMFCVTAEGAYPGDPRVSAAGGPISQPGACLALPTTQ